MLFAKVVISANRRKYAALCAHQRSQGLDKRARALGLFKFQSFDLLFTLSSRTRAKFSLKESFQSTQRRNHVRCFMLACTVRLHAAGVKNSIAARALHLILQWMRGARQHQQLTHCQTCKLFIRGLKKCLKKEVYCIFENSAADPSCFAVTITVCEHRFDDERKDSNLRVKAAFFVWVLPHIFIYGGSPTRIFTVRKASACHCRDRLRVPVVCREHCNGRSSSPCFQSQFLAYFSSRMLQLHAHLDSLLASRPSAVFNVVYLPRVLFPCSDEMPSAPTPCMLTAEVSRALQGNFVPRFRFLADSEIFTLVCYSLWFRESSECRASNVECHSCEVPLPVQGATFIPVSTNLFIATVCMRPSPFACPVIRLKVHQRVWSFHVDTDFFAPYPSPADKWVFSIFARDFKGSFSVSAVLHDMSPHVPSITASSSPTFDTVLDCTRRLCRQACLPSLLRSPSSHLLSSIGSAAEHISITQRLILVLIHPK